MRTRRLGNLEVSAVGLGCMGMSHAYGDPANKQEVLELVALAVDNGVTLFDTAEVYGTSEEPHHNESLIGEALKPYRDRVVISTKFGLRFDYDCKDWNLPVIADSRPESIRRAHAVTPLTAIQNRYSMMARWHETLFPMLEELGIGYMAFSPLANGLLSEQYQAGCAFDKATDYRAGMPQFKKESFEANKELFALVDGLADKYWATPAQISLAWMLCKKPWIVPIPGTRKLFRLKENIGAADIDISQEEIAAIDKALATMSMSEVYGGTKVIKQ